MTCSCHGVQDVPLLKDNTYKRNLPIDPIPVYRLFTEEPYNFGSCDLDEKDSFICILEDIDPKKLSENIEELKEKLLSHAPDSGRHTSLALGALIASGIDSREALIKYADDLDLMTRDLARYLHKRKIDSKSSEAIVAYAVYRWFYQERKGCPFSTHLFHEAIEALSCGFSLKNGFARTMLYNYFASRMGLDIRISSDPLHPVTQVYTKHEIIEIDHYKEQGQQIRTFYLGATDSAKSDSVLNIKTTTILDIIDRIYNRRRKFEKAQNPDSPLLIPCKI